MSNVNLLKEYRRTNKIYDISVARNMNTSLIAVEEYEEYLHNKLKDMHNLTPMLKDPKVAEYLESIKLPKQGFVKLANEYYDEKVIVRNNVMIIRPKEKTHRNISHLDISSSTYATLRDSYIETMDDLLYLTEEYLIETNKSINMLTVESAISALGKWCKSNNIMIENYPVSKFSLESFYKKRGVANYEDFHMIDRYAVRHDIPLEQGPLKAIRYAYDTTMKDIGDNIGISRERVRQVENKASRVIQRYSSNINVVNKNETINRILKGYNITKDQMWNVIERNVSINIDKQKDNHYIVTPLPILDRGIEHLELNNSMFSNMIYANIYTIGQALMMTPRELKTQMTAGRYKNPEKDAYELILSIKEWMTKHGLEPQLYPLYQQEDNMLVEKGIYFLKVRKTAQHYNVFEDYRSQKDITQTKVAELVGTQPPRISTFEHRAVNALHLLNDLSENRLEALVGILNHRQFKKYVSTLNIRNDDIIELVNRILNTPLNQSDVEIVKNALDDNFSNSNLLLQFDWDENIYNSLFSHGIYTTNQILKLYPHELTSLRSITDETIVELLEDIKDITIDYYKYPLFYKAIRKPDTIFNRYRLNPFNANSNLIDQIKQLTHHPYVEYKVSEITKTEEFENLLDKLNISNEESINMIEITLGHSLNKDKNGELIIIEEPSIEITEESIDPDAPRFPLEETTRVDELNIKTRTRNVLYRQRMELVSDVLRATHKQLLMFPRMGVGGAKDLKNAILEWSTKYDVDVSHHPLFKEETRRKELNDKMHPKSIWALNLTNRAHNALEKEGMVEIKDIVQCTPETIMSIHNIGVTSFNDIIDSIKEWSKKEKVDITGYPLYQ